MASVNWKYIGKAFRRFLNLSRQGVSVSIADHYCIYKEGGLPKSHRTNPDRSFWLRTKSYCIFFAYWPKHGWHYATYYPDDRHFLWHRWKGYRTKKERDVAYLICSALNGPYKGWSERKLIQKMLGLEIEGFWARKKVR